ncbi:uncharacterized protein LOC142985087 [Anticarsia gemmatalis]|uniref:uncharacterized protein LOC142985087 n=1 Tax=Anticarsia gemmatalis TaxID=129554 RepID=UPI003F76D6E6
MSVTREDERQKNGCPSRGLGIAAAAIGVGVGAALYYFFNKRAENPNSEGSTSDWNCERPQPFYISSDDSYTTISEHETTDTSINEITDSSNELITLSDSDDYSDYTTDSESDTEDFDVTTSSLGVPDLRSSSRSPMMSLIGSRNWLWTPRVSPRRTRTELTEDEQMAMIRQEQFRERSWTLEECSICFDVMLRNQEVTRLPCAHNFHTECILPWLQEKQTCPNCRKAAE